MVELIDHDERNLYNLKLYILFILVKPPDQKSDVLAYKRWMREQDDIRYQFQSKWFEVVLKERGSESSNSPVSVLERSKEEDFPQRKMFIVRCVAMITFER